MTKCDFEKNNNVSLTKTDNLPCRACGVLDVYIAKLPKDSPIGTVKCKARMNEINSIANESVKREKYFVWKLLCYALEKSFGLCEENLAFQKENYGGWTLDDVKISLAHSDGALAVAVSDTAVGVDVELVRAPKKKDFCERIMTPQEMLRFDCLPEEEKELKLIEIWSAKEAIFKSKGLCAFIPKDIDTLSSQTKSEAVWIDGKKYVFSVCSEILKNLRVFTNINLEK